MHWLGVGTLVWMMTVYATCKEVESGKPRSISAYTNYSMFNCVQKMIRSLTRPPIFRANIFEQWIVCAKESFACKGDKEYEMLPNSFAREKRITAGFCGLIELIKTTNIQNTFVLLELTTRQHLRLNMTFTQFNMKWSRFCNDTYLELHAKRRCGFLPPWSEFSDTNRIVLEVQAERYVTRKGAHVIFMYRTMLAQNSFAGNTEPTVIKTSAVTGQFNVHVYASTYQFQSKAVIIFHICVAPINTILIRIDEHYLDRKSEDVKIYDGSSLRHTYLPLNLLDGVYSTVTTTYLCTLVVVAPMISSDTFIVQYDAQQGSFETYHKYLSSDTITDSSLVVAVHNEVVNYIVETGNRSFIDVFVSHFTHDGYDHDRCIYSGVYMTQIKDNHLSQGLCKSFFNQHNLARHGRVHVFTSSSNALSITVYSLYQQLHVTLEFESSHCSGAVIYGCGPEETQFQSLIKSALYDVQRWHSCRKLLFLYDGHQSCRYLIQTDDQTGYFQFNMTLDLRRSVTECFNMYLQHDDIFRQIVAPLPNKKLALGTSLQLFPHIDQTECSTSTAVVEMVINSFECLQTSVANPDHTAPSLPTLCGEILFRQPPLSEQFNIEMMTASTRLRYYQINIIGTSGDDRCLKGSSLRIRHRESAVYNWDSLYAGMEWNTVSTSAKIFVTFTQTCNKKSQAFLEFHTMQYKKPHYTTPQSRNNTCRISHGKYSKEYFRLAPESRSMSWSKASRTCRQNDGQLVSFYNYEELETFLVSTLDKDCSDEFLDLWHRGLTFIGLRYVDKVSFKHEQFIK